NGGRWWRFRYRFDDKEKLISFGTYPDVGLKDARQRRDAARHNVAMGIDPSAERQAAKKSVHPRPDLTFEAIAREWFDKRSPNWAPSHSHTVVQRLRDNIFPFIGARQIDQITPPELLEVLRRVEA